MNHRRLLIVLGAGLAVATTTLGFGSFLAGCADYHSDPGADAGGAGGTGATPSTGGAPAAGGAPATGGQGTGGGGAGLPATGGAAGSAGRAGAATGGSAGLASGGAATGGSASGSAGSGSAGAPPSTCDNFDNVTACGGDLAGTWTVSGACVKVSGTIDLTGLGADCKSGEITAGTLMVTGTFTATADMFTDATQTTGDETLELPQTCKTLSGTETTCKRIGGPLKSIGFDSATCVDNATTMGCTCTATVNQTGGLGLVYPNFPTSGSYTVAESNVTLSDGLHEFVYPFCVAGTTLTVSQPAMAKSGTYAGTVVLQKQ